jgi:hypothetical protein
MDVKVIKGDCEHVCHSQEQLERFINAGWTQEAEKAPAKAAVKKKTSK